MRIGLFGGSFDPIHWGHLRTASAILNAFALTQVRLIPSAVPPHKPTGALATFDHRVAMIRAAVADTPGLVVSDIEGRRSGPSFTIDTVRQCLAEAPAGADLFLIVGLDAFLEIDSWKAYQDLFQTTALVVAGRPGQDTGPGPFSSWVADFVARQISTGYRLASTGDRLDHPDRPSVYLFSGPTVAVSSTQVRECIGQGRAIDHLVPLPVAQYIDRQGLYR